MAENLKGLSLRVLALLGAWLAIFLLDDVGRHFSPWWPANGKGWWCALSTVWLFPRWFFLRYAKDQSNDR